MLLIFICYSFLTSLSFAQNETVRAKIKHGVGSGEGFYKTTTENITVQPKQCKLMAYDMERAEYRYQIAVNYDYKGCRGDRDFHASQLLTPALYMEDVVEVVSLPFEMCMLQLEHSKLLPEFNQSYLVVWQNVTFVILEQGELDYYNFTCYKGWQYQIFANNCSEQQAEVQVRIDSGGNSHKLVEYDCVEKGYTILFVILSFVVLISLIFSCSCCCCLFCDCCLPCARFCARIKIQYWQAASATSIEQCQVENKQVAAQNKLKKQNEIANRVSVHSTEGQTRWITFTVCIASVIFLWLQIYPPAYNTDPNRVDYSATSVCEGYINTQDGAGYVKKICSFANIFVNSYFMGLSTFIIVLSNYTTRPDPWFRFRVIISSIALFFLNLILFLDVVTFFYRYQYVQMVIRYYYAYAVIAIHLIVADFLFLFIVVLGYGQKNNTRILERSPLIKKVLVKEKQETRDLMNKYNKFEKLIHEFKKWLVSFWDVLKEEEGFKYSIFMLISVAAANYLIVFIFITLMYKRDDYLDCLKSFNDCISREMETYVVFIQRRIGVGSIVQLMSDVNATQMSIQDVNDTIADLQLNIESVSAVSGDGQFGNMSAAIKNVTSLCESFLLADAASVPAIQQICQYLNSSQLQPLFQALQGDYLGALARHTDFVQQILDKTEGLLGRTNTLIVASTESSSEWTENIDTPFQVASIIGLVIGLLMGISVLYITLVSYKKITIHLTLEKYVMALSNEEQHQSETLRHTLENFTVISSIYFFGIVLSTSVIQMYIFTFFLTFALTVLFSPWFWTVFLKEYYPYIAVYVGIMLINTFVVVRLGQRLVSHKDQSIKRPALWLAYYIICSFAYLLLGMLFAVYRILYLLLTSLIAINRLDITLFTIMPNLDNGHKAFMGMVLMAQALADIGRGRNRKKKKAEARWKKIKLAVKDEEGQLLRKLRESTLAQPSLFQIVDDQQYDDDVDNEHRQGPFLDHNVLTVENIDEDQEQIAAIKKYLSRSQSAIDSMDANTIPQAQIRSHAFGGPSCNHVAFENQPNN